MSNESKKKRDREYSRQWRKNNPEKIKAYLERSKERRAEVRKEYMEKTGEERKKYDNEYYAKNREKRIKGSNGIQKMKGHPCEKKPERRNRAEIRRQTRKKYPLEGNKCSVDGCIKKAKYRHHTTEPMKVDKFEFLCTEHHNDKHNKRTFANVGESEAC